MLSRLQLLIGILCLAALAASQQDELENLFDDNVDDLGFDAQENTDVDMEDMSLEDEEAVSGRLQKVLVKMYGLPMEVLRDFGTELSGIKEKLTNSFNRLESRRERLQSELSSMDKTIEALKKNIKALNKRIAEMKRRAVADAKKRAERLRKELKKRMAAHKAGMRFVQKLRDQVKALREEVPDFKQQVSDIQTHISDFSDVLEDWTGVDVLSELEENKGIGMDNQENRLYTKKHLNKIVEKMLSNLRASYENAKAALAKAHAGYENPHVRKLEEERNGEVAKLSQLQAKAADIATQLARHAHIKGELRKIATIENYIYTCERVARVQPVQGCLPVVRQCHQTYNRCENKLRTAVANNAPPKERYVLWKQYIVAKGLLAQHVAGCRKAMEEAEAQEEQN